MELYKLFILINVNLSIMIHSAFKHATFNYLHILKVKKIIAFYLNSNLHYLCSYKITNWIPFPMFIHDVIGI